MKTNQPMQPMQPFFKSFQNYLATSATSATYFEEISSNFDRFLEVVQPCNLFALNIF